MTQNVLVYFMLMALGIVVLLGAAFIGARDKRGKKLNTHKALGGIGMVLVLLGAVGLVVTRALRPTLPYFYLALLAIVFMILTPIVGLLYLKAAPAKKAALRKSHRFDAAIFFGLVALTVIFGIIGFQSMRR